jgi:hypothetical protein
MNSAAGEINTKPIGTCTHAEGVITLRRQDDTLARLKPGMDIFENEEVTTTGAGHAAIGFVDHGEIAIDPTTSLRFERYQYNRKPDDSCRIKLFHGVIGLMDGRMATEPDALIIDAGPITLNVHAASLICRLAPNGVKADVTLLSPSSSTCGEILVHNNVAIQTLNTRNQTLRTDGRYGYVSKPMIVTSNVLRETYKGPAVGPILQKICDMAREDEEVELEVIYDTDPQGFEMFRDLNDRLLERRFLTQHIYPGGEPEEDRYENELLEDAFDGERFRLKHNSDQ